MPNVHVHFGATQTGLSSGDVFHTTADWYLDTLERGMASGKTSIMLRIPINDPEIVNDPEVKKAGATMWTFAETSLKAWMAAARLLASKYRDELEDEEVGWVVMPQVARDAITPRFAEVLRRIVPTMTAEQATASAGMFIDALGAGAPGS